MPGQIYEGPITKILDFGALVQILPGKDGLLHISQIAHQRVERVEDFLKEGQIVKVKVLETDEKGRIKLSLKALLDKPEGYVEEERPRRDFGDRDRGGRGGDRDRGPRRDNRGDRPPRGGAGRRAEAKPRRTRRPTRTTSTRVGIDSRDARDRDQPLRRPRGAAADHPTRPGRRAGRGADPRGRVGRQPARCAAAQRAVPDAAGRVGPAGAGSRGHDRRRRPAMAAVQASATASARWWPAAAMPSCAWRRRRRRCRCRAACPTSKRRACPRPSSPSGRTSFTSLA